MPMPEELEAAKAEEAKVAEAAQAEHVKAVANAVRESFGLKEGERLDDKMRGMATSSMNHQLKEQFGLKEGQTISDVIADAVKASQEQETLPKKKGDTAAQELESMRGIMSQLKEDHAADKQERAADKQELADERRTNLIRTELDKFPIADFVKKTLFRAFDGGSEANPELAEGGKAVVVDVSGHKVPFSEFLGQYFKSNDEFLKAEEHRGTSAKGSDSSRKNGKFEFDISKYYSNDGDDLQKEMRDNPDGAEEREGTIKKSVNERLKAMGLNQI